MYGLGGMRDRFVVEYCKDLNATQAVIRSGYAKDSAHVRAHELLHDQKVLAAIDERKEELVIAAALSKEWVLRQWWLVATADPNDLCSVEVLPCPYCWEGLAYNRELPINPECSKCMGSGVSRVAVADTRKLKGSAKALYNGAYQTKDGIKIQTRDRDLARDNIAKYLGMVITKGEISGPGGTPIAIANAKPDDLTDEQLAAIVATRQS